jgi:hypothetical protein
MEEDRLSLLPPVHRSNPHGFTYTGYLLFSLAESFLPLPPVQRVPVCVSPLLPSCAHVMCSSCARHSLISFPSACTVCVRLGHRLATFIDPWRCTARTARCPPTGLISRYRPDEFMSEVTTVFPCSIPLSGAREHVGWFLNPFCFLLLASWELYIN